VGAGVWGGGGSGAGRGDLGAKRSMELTLINSGALQNDFCTRRLFSGTPTVISKPWASREKVGCAKRQQCGESYYSAD